MGLFIKNNDNNEKRRVVTIIKTNRYVAAVYQGSRLVWQYIRSCFGRGYWINEKPWSETDGWKN